MKAVVKVLFGGFIETKSGDKIAFGPHQVNVDPTSGKDVEMVVHNHLNGLLVGAGVKKEDVTAVAGNLDMSVNIENGAFVANGTLDVKLDLTKIPKDADANAVEVQAEDDPLSEEEMAQFANFLGFRKAS